MAVCDCLKHIHRQVYDSRRHLWTGVTVYNTFMGGCTFLEYGNGWTWVLRLFKAHLWVGVPF